MILAGILSAPSRASRGPAPESCFDSGHHAIIAWPTADDFVSFLDRYETGAVRAPALLCVPFHRRPAPGPSRFTVMSPR